MLSRVHSTLDTKQTNTASTPRPTAPPQQQPIKSQQPPNAPARPKGKSLGDGFDESFVGERESVMTWLYSLFAEDADDDDDDDDDGTEATFATRAKHESKHMDEVETIWSWLSGMSFKLMMM